MPVAFPPALPPQLVSVQHVKQAEKSAGKPITEKVGQAQIPVTVVGNRLLSEKTVRSVLKKAKNPAQAIKLLNKTYHSKGHLLVKLLFAGDVKKRHVYIEVKDGYLTEVRGPKELRRYFTGLLHKHPLSANAFRKDLILANLDAKRAGLKVDTTYTPNQAHPEQVSMGMQATHKKGHRPVHLNLSFGNPGNRFVGRYFGGIGVSGSTHDGFSYSLNYLHAFPSIGKSTSSNARLNSGEFSINDVRPSGLYSLTGQAVEYAGDLSAVNTNTASGSSSSTTTTTSTCLVQSLPLLNNVLCPVLGSAGLNSTTTTSSGSGSGSSSGHFHGKIFTTQFTANQLAFAGETTRLIFDEGIGYTISTIDTNEQPKTLLNERYATGQLGATVTRNYSLFGRKAHASFTGNVRQGAGGGGTLGGKGPVVATDSQGNIRDNEADGYFTLGKANAQLQQSMPASFETDLNLDGQYTPDRTPQQENWVLGGPDQLAAYLPGVIYGDSGLFGRLTFKSPQWKGLYVPVQAGLFVEAGMSKRENVPGRLKRVASAADHPELAGNTQMLADYGLKLTFKAWKGTHLGVSSALPLFHRAVRSQMRKNYRAYFYFTAKARF